MAYDWFSCFWTKETFDTAGAASLVPLALTGLPFLQPMPFFNPVQFNSTFWVPTFARHHARHFRWGLLSAKLLETDT